MSNHDQEQARYYAELRRWEEARARRMKSRILIFLLIIIVTGAFLTLWPQGQMPGFEPAWSNITDRPVVETQQRSAEPRPTAFPTTKVVIHNLVDVPTMTPIPPTPTITPQTSDAARSGVRPSGGSGVAPTETPGASIVPVGDQRPSEGGG